MNILKKTLTTVVAASALAMTAVAQAPTKNIVEIAAGNENFTTLVSLVKKAGLVEVLAGEGPFTVFAPTNKAFEKLPKATLEAVGNDPELLKAVLTYHVVPGRVMAADVVKLKEAKTVQKGKINIAVKDGSVFLNGNTKVVTTDIVGTNGVIHVIDTVLIPPMETEAKMTTVSHQTGGCSN